MTAKEKMVYDHILKMGEADIINHLSFLEKMKGNPKMYFPYAVGELGNGICRIKGKIAIRRPAPIPIQIIIRFIRKVLKARNAPWVTSWRGYIARAEVASRMLHSPTDISFYKKLQRMTGKSPGTCRMMTKRFYRVTNESIIISENSAGLPVAWRWERRAM